MSIRRGGWLLGAALGSSLSACLAADPSTRHLAVSLGLLALALAGLLAEFVALIGAGRGRARRFAPHDATPADGVVGVAALVSLDGRANAVDPRWRRFQSPAGGDLPPRPGFLEAEASPSLLGRITVFSIFLGADGRGWTDGEIARGHASLERAGTWIEREAARLGAPIHVELAGVYFQSEEESAAAVELGFVAEGEDVGPLEADAGVKYLAMASRAAARFGFADAADLQGRVNELVRSDRRVWLLHLRQAGRSIAIPASESDLAGVGLAVCFAREASFPEPLGGPGRVDPTTVVHELFHLFGASDKYGTPLRSFPPKSVSSADIMKLDHDHLGRMRVDALTALEVGWRQSLDRSGP